MEIEPLVQDVNMVCSTKRKVGSEDKVISVSDDVRDVDFIRVCTTRGNGIQKRKVCQSLKEL